MLSNVCVRAKSLHSCLTLCDPRTVAYQAPLSMGFSRQEYWSGLPCPPPRDLPDPRIKPASLMSPALAVRFFTTSTTWETRIKQFSSVQFSCSVVSGSFQPHEPQHARPPCPSPTPGVHPNPCPSSRWCHPTISSSVVPSPPAFNLSQHQGLFKWVSSSHQVAKVSFSASTSVLPMHTQDWSPLGWI